MPSYSYGQVYGPSQPATQINVLANYPNSGSSTGPVKSGTIISRHFPPDAGLVPPFRSTNKGDASLNVFDQAPVHPTKPLKLKQPKYNIGTESISRPVLQSSTNMASQPGPVPLPKSILKHRAPVANSIPAPTESMPTHTRLHSNSAPRPTNAPKVTNYGSQTSLKKGQVTSSSESSSSLTNYSSSTEGVRSLSRGLNFPLPPTTLASIPASASAKSSIDKDRRRFSVASVSSRKRS